MLSEEEIVSTIMGFATRCGDPAPSAIRYVRGTRGELNAVMGAVFHGADADTPAVLVEATGHFTWHHRGLGAAAYSSGTTITLVINEHTGAGIDAGISAKPYDWSSLGTVHHPAVPT